ncbi:leucine zipper domain-containing protein [Nesterenkonia sp. LB17]
MSRTAAYRWLRRYREEGPAGLIDRSSRPRNSPPPPRQ